MHKKTNRQKRRPFLRRLIFGDFEAALGNGFRAWSYWRRILKGKIEALEEFFRVGLFSGLSFTRVRFVERFLEEFFWRRNIEEKCDLSTSLHYPSKFFILFYF